MPTRTPDCQELADDILKRITWYPESYDQGSWQTVARDFLKKLLPKGGSTHKLAATKAARAKAAPTLQNCQTTGCIAGTASIIVGDIPAVSVDEESLVGGYGNLSVDRVITSEGEYRSIQARGAELLCLSDGEKEWLFAGGRTLSEVTWALREISEGKPISRLHETRMTAAQLAEIRAYRHQLQAQRPKINYVATNKLTPRKAKEAALAAKKKAEARRAGL